MLNIEDPSLGSLSGGEGDFGSDSVEVLGALLGDDPGVDFELVALLVLLDHLELLELLESPSDDLSSSINVVGEAVSCVLGGSVEVCQKSDSGSGSDINLPGERGHSDV